MEKIEKAYSYASKTLLDLLMDERALMARLRRGVKFYLFVCLFVCVFVLKLQQ